MTANTRTAILAHIVEKGGASVSELSAAVGLADATVRRHLDRLAAEGLAETREPVRQATGRPYQVYQATPAGVRRQRDHSSGLVARLLGEIQHGSADLQAIAAGVARRVAADHRAAVTEGGPLEQRVSTTVDALHGEGILDSWERTEHGYRLQNHACPYREAAEASDCVCESDRLAIEDLVGANVKLIGSLARGDDSCEYLVTEGVPSPSKEKGHP